MPQDHISLRQMLSLFFAALLSLAALILPGATVEAAGKGAWLSSLLALPIALALCWVLFALIEPGEGLAQAYERALGRALGKLVLFLYLVWGVLLLCVSARLVALRFLATSYRNGPLGLFVVCLLGVGLWLCRKPLGVLGRTAEVFCLALAIGLGAVLFFGAFQVEARHVLPLWVEDLPGIGLSVLPVLGLLAWGIFAAFLAGGGQPGPRDRRRAMLWMTALCLVLTVLQLVCLGAFGPGLTTRMERPFFMMVKGIGVGGGFQRVESLVIALWVLADLALLALLIEACSVLAQSLFVYRKREWGILPLAALGAAGAMFLFPEAYTLDWLVGKVVLPGNLVFGFLLPLIGLAGKKLRRFEKRC